MYSWHKRLFFLPPFGPMTSLVLSKEHTQQNTPSARTAVQPTQWLVMVWSPLLLGGLLRGGLLFGRGRRQTRKNRVSHVSVARKSDLGTGRQHIRTELLAGEILPLAA